MTIHVFLQRTGISAIRRVAVLLVFVLALSGCDREALLAVKAVAVGVPSLAPFFDEKSGLGQDAQVASRPVRGSLQQGDTPGLYGGSKQPTVCDVDKLENFLTDPRNDQKAQAWARALKISTNQIPEYLDRLTPVLLRHDTLVKNHDYKKGKAVPYDSLLQAGIAILVDQQGQPAVKCSCGNPLRPFEGDTSKISVKFEDGNEEWKGYDRSSVVAVRPAARPLKQIALVDVEEPDRGLSRPVGTTGTKDAVFDTREKREVPNLAGATFGQARQALTDKGLAVGYESKGLPPDDAEVMATDPPAGTELEFGQYVMLSVAEDSGSSGSSDSSGSSGSSGSGGSTTTPPGPSSSGPSSPGSSGPDGSSSPPSSSSSSSPPASSSSSSSPPASSSSSSAPPASPSPPASSSSAPPPSTSSDPPPSSTSAAPPPPPPPPETTATSAPPPPPPPPETTSAPPETSTAPASTTPATSEPATEEPPATAAA
ncbi:PASTA domain-containing protein [Streptomyces sp. S.PB5]|uniref:PASTA domain-containing protein n=1 Tax=Streptomyces sp. S.PB5 TaxID=3020844 RepID=UPI0025B1C2A9|nr:PASTA domain-containing protein [Streptomyces sp. S.PB5]MDN3027771.1 PASTA domain-containing protein [Streptomyces sp. S.PB5]